MNDKPSYEKLEQRIKELEEETDRHKQADEALLESEEKYRLLIENIPSVAWITSEHGKTTFISPNVEKVYGFSNKEIYEGGDSLWFERIYPDDLVLVKESFEMLFSKEREFDIEYRIQRKDGEWIWLHDMAILAFEKDDIRYAYGVFSDITDRKKVDDVLRESEGKYRLLTENAKDMIYRMSLPDGIYEYVSPASIDLFGYTPEEFYESPMLIQKVIHPDWADYFEKQWTNLLNGETPPFYEYQIIKKSGNERWIHQRNVFILDDTKQSRAIEAVVSDITDRKQAENALRESEIFSASLLEHSPNPIVVLNADTSIRYVNPAFEKLTGYASVEIKGKLAPHPWWIDDLRSANIDERREAILKGTPTLKKVFRKRNGEDFWVETTTTPIKQNGELQYALTTWVEITEQKQTEEALYESDERLKLALDSVSDAVWDWRLDTDKVYFSSRWYTMLEYEPYELPEAFETWRNLLHPDDLPYAEQTVMQHLELAKPFELEFRMKTKGGHWKWVLARGKTVEKDDRGKALRMLGTHIDITERKILEVQLQQAQKMESIGTLAGGIAHDFNNILSPIMMHSEMAAMGLPPDSPVQHNLKEIFKAGERARDMVKQILAFSRKGEGKLAAIQITAILKEVLRLLRSSIPTTIEIKQNLGVESDTVLADPTQIHQIILNLGTNAAHAMREKGGILEVSLVQEDLDIEAAAQYADLNPGSYLKLIVKDNGSGIDDKTMGNIFEPYFTTKRIGEGTGMGLALVHGIVKSYGGDITVESELGEGTTFEVYLPRIEKEAASIPEPSVQLPKGSERVLFVDDEKVSMDVMKAMLENLGYKVTARTSSIEALEAFKNEPNGFDLVITDMTMPNMTGKELAKEIMSIRSGMPIILCTGFSEQIDKVRAKEMGISAYLMKPIVMSDIADTIREVLDKR